MRTIVFAVVAAALLVAIWPRRPVLPGEQFQLAVGNVAPTQQAAAHVIMGHVGKGDGWM